MTTTRLLAGTALLAASVLAMPARAIDANLCLSPPFGLSIIAGTPGNDQIIGTILPELIFGMGGHDVIKGMGGDDVLCGGDGNDGLNGGPGNDVLGGGDGNDLLVGHDGDDSIWGDAGRDALYGGNGNDAEHGNDDSEYDYVAGGPGTGDTLFTGSGDDAFPDSQDNTTCPNDISRRVGAFGSYSQDNNDSRLDPQGANPCKTIIGSVTSVKAADDNDGDLHLVVRETSTGKNWIVEFMPRDFTPFPLLAVGNDVEISGLHVLDGHTPPHEEIHPVYKVRRVNISTNYWSGPRHAGSPHKMRPENVCAPVCGTGGTSHRFCWTELGQACTPWANKLNDPSDVEDFQLLRDAIDASLGWDTESYQ